MPRSQDRACCAMLCLLAGRVMMPQRGRNDGDDALL